MSFTKDSMPNTTFDHVWNMNRDVVFVIFVIYNLPCSSLRTFPAQSIEQHFGIVSTTKGF